MSETKFVRIRIDFPKLRPLSVNPRTCKPVNPMSVELKGYRVVQGEPFLEVPAEIAASFATMGYYSEHPISDDNPPKFEVVATRAEAERGDKINAERFAILGQAATALNDTTGWHR